MRGKFGLNKEKMKLSGEGELGIGCRVPCRLTDAEEGSLVAVEDSGTEGEEVGKVVCDPPVNKH